ncbi:MAG: hypothetical protein ISR65_18530 [Bacteriovoracaceae bacterium]|nr:hypothetical protein [candidate division KSB1 bacterium]MBL6991785.1 hypothetical protein [Bacteriovoracaceae bacterium]
MKTKKQIQARIYQINNPNNTEEMDAYEKAFANPYDVYYLDEGQQSWIQALEWVLED